ncbi:MAG: site-specific integrase [Methanomassiliicoccus sp.]|nr:site-specific integrase [Methanomassiliicoccus sp.]
MDYIRNEVYARQKNGVKRRHLAVLNTYLKWHGNTVIRDMKIKWPQDEKLPPEHLSPSQALSILDAAQGLERLVIHLELNLGLRRVEVLRLKPGSFKVAYLSVQGKGRGGGKWRMVPYRPDTLAELKAYQQLREEEIARAREKNPAVKVPDALLIYERGGRLHAYQKTALDKLVKGVAARTGIPFSNHTLRRTYGRTLWEANKRFPGMCPIETIAELMGHRDVRTTVLYLGINLADMADAMGTLARYQELVRNQNLFSQNIMIESGQSGI